MGSESRSSSKDSNIDPPESPSIVKTIDIGYGEWVDLVDGFAYVGAYTNGLQVIDVSVPESAYVVEIISDPAAVGIVVVDGQIAYVSEAREGGVRIVGL